jgi:hypothetical protein
MGVEICLNIDSLEKEKKLDLKWIILAVNSCIQNQNRNYFTPDIHVEIPKNQAIGFLHKSRQYFFNSQKFPLKNKLQIPDHYWTPPIKTNIQITLFEKP